MSSVEALSFLEEIFYGRQVGFGQLESLSCCFMHELIVGLNQENLAKAATVKDGMSSEVWIDQFLSLILQKTEAQIISTTSFLSTKPAP